MILVVLIFLSIFSVLLVVSHVNNVRKFSVKYGTIKTALHEVALSSIRISSSTDEIDALITARENVTLVKTFIQIYGADVINASTKIDVEDMLDVLLKQEKSLRGNIQAHIAGHPMNSIVAS